MPGFRDHNPNGVAPSTHVKSFAHGKVVNYDAKLDEITGGKIRDPSRVTVFDIDTSFRQIQSLPSRDEQVALTATLLSRLNKYGVSKGWMETTNEEKRTSSFTKFMIEMFCLDKSAGDKVVDEFKDKLLDFIQTGLTSGGAAGLRFLKTAYDLIEADTLEKRLAILSKAGGAALIAWLAKNGATLHKVLKAAGVEKPLRNAVLKRLGAVITFCETWLERVAPILVAIDVFFTSAPIATDDEEARVTFLLIYNEAVKAGGDIITGGNGLFLERNWLQEVKMAVTSGAAFRMP